MLAGFNLVFVLPRIVKDGDAAATADNIRGSATLFRAGFVGDVTGATFWLLAAMALYLMFKPVNQPVAAAMVIFTAVGAAIMIVSALYQYTALTVATGDPNAFGKPAADGLTQLLTGLQHNGYVVDEMFFGLWLLPLGYLVFKSGYLPKFLGVLLVVACVGYLTDLYLAFLAPDLSGDVVGVVIALARAGELPFMLWLLIMGVRTPPRVESRPGAVASRGRRCSRRMPPRCSSP